MSQPPMTHPVVTRFAPSPTGFMHIGGIRTALFAYLWARKNKGTFILRIEDTDKKREVQGAIAHIQEALKWLGLAWDYGPDKPGDFKSCIQSERLEIYQTYARKLLDKGLAYPDPYTEAEVEAFRAAAEAAKKPFLYRDHRPSAVDMAKPWDGTRPLRLKIAEIKRTRWHDMVRGDLEAGEEALDDFILIKSDGYPTYNFAHIVDDCVMGVTHVLRGEEFISSTPNYLSLYAALGVTPPHFATLPPILREDRIKKLSKRDGAKDILEYRAEGYVPEAMLNILALIGWNPGTEQEVFDLQGLISAFDISKVQKSGGIFNEEKLQWFNHQHLKLLSDDAFVTRVTPFLPDWLSGDTAALQRLLPLIREKTIMLADASQLFAASGELAFVQALPKYDPAALPWKKNPDKAAARTHIAKAREVLASLPASATVIGGAVDSFTADAFKAALWPYAEQHGKGDVLWPVRMALTGQERSPDPFSSAAILGRAESLRRLDAALAALV